MYRHVLILLVFVGIFLFQGCSTSYKVKPLPFKTPTSYDNVVTVAGAQVAAKAFNDAKQAKEIFGFDIHGAGMLPVQVVFDNEGNHSFEISGDQTFLEDEKGNLWPVLSREIAYKRATKYAKTKDVVKEGAYHSVLGAAAGSLIGAAIGIVSGDNVATAAAKGAAVGAAAGATMGGAGGYSSDNARMAIIDDLHGKSLQNKPVEPKSLAHGILFFPGEAASGRQLRLQIIEIDTGRAHTIKLDL
ncbi:MAG: hypothetical protein JRD93_09520 [Deltaproteobacteria bacterium]|nr:hypothetical protein [Deltaproteobacteria bacterium]MBW2662208.1 hypothetical protein [Deltaproteobacteria bacterium]